jgi:hypothetical protein
MQIKIKEKKNKDILGVGCVIIGESSGDPYLIVKIAFGQYAAVNLKTSNLSLTYDTISKLASSIAHKQKFYTSDEIKLVLGKDE